MYFLPLIMYMPGASLSRATPNLTSVRTFLPSMENTSMTLSSFGVMPLMFVGTPVHVRTPSLIKALSSHVYPPPSAIIHVAPALGLVPGKTVNLSPADREQPSRGFITIVSLTILRVVPSTLKQS